jgi:hypothetical protein
LALNVALFLADRPPPPLPFSNTNEHTFKTAPDRKNMLAVVRQQPRYETLIL